MDVKTAIQGLPDVDWRDISAEFFREYLMPSGQIIKLINPLLLHVSASGGHYVIDDRGYTHYIPNKWERLTWFNKEGYPLCRFVSPPRGG